jgi:xanthine dehydrogenase accessory factor
VGAKLVINEDGEIFGSVSGGCVENEVIEEALACIKSGKPKMLHYGISDDTAFSVGMMCGGEIDVYIQPVNSNPKSDFGTMVVDQVITMQKNRKPFGMLVTVSGKQAGHTCILEYKNGKVDELALDWFDKRAYEQFNQAMRAEKSQIIETIAGKVYLDVQRPAPRLVIIGAVHIAMTLVRVARMLDYYTVLIDPRKVFATAERFPQVDEMLLEWPPDGMQKIGLSAEDYVLLISHDDKLDLPAAGAAIEAGVEYIGMLASRTTRERRFALLRDEGYQAQEVEKIHAPVGLAIGARTPEEIALSILAEITDVRYGRK